MEKMTVKIFGNVGKKFTNIVHYTLNMAFTAPTAIRKARNSSGGEYDGFIEGGGFIAAYLSLAGSAFLDTIYWSCEPSSLNDWQSFAYKSLPIATHALSGLYELVRHEKRKILKNEGTESLIDLS